MGRGQPNIGGGAPAYGGPGYGGAPASSRRQLSPGKGGQPRASSRRQMNSPMPGGPPAYGGAPYNAAPTPGYSPAPDWRTADLKGPYGGGYSLPGAPASPGKGGQPQINRPMPGGQMGMPGPWGGSPSAAPPTGVRPPGKGGQPQAQPWAQPMYGQQRVSAQPMYGQGRMDDQLARDLAYRAEPASRVSGAQGTYGGPVSGGNMGKMAQLGRDISSFQRPHSGYQRYNPGVDGGMGRMGPPPRGGRRGGGKRRQER